MILVYSSCQPFCLRVAGSHLYLVICTVLTSGGLKLPSHYITSCVIYSFHYDGILKRSYAIFTMFLLDFHTPVS